jgi:hypothetical protein
MRNNGGRAEPRTAEVRFDAAEWEAVEWAATQAGVTVSEYTRAAALERAAIEARPNGRRRARRADDIPAKVLDECGGNIPYVGQLWEAFKRGGVSAMSKLTPPDVIWRPLAASGHTLHGTRELEEFWSSRDVVMPSLRMFHGHGNDVLVLADYPQEDGTVSSVWLRYRFDGDRLVEAIGFEDETQARSYGGPEGG